jgi:hypothetical protein
VDDVVVPAVLRALVTPDVAEELAGPFGDTVVFPGRIEVDRPDDPERRFPGWPTPVLLVSVENQGVVSWGVPLDTDDPPVLVGGEIADGDAYSDTTVEYAPSVERFVATRRWDRALLERGLLVQAQAEELADPALAFLRGAFEEVLPTRGWPAVNQYRFQRADAKIMLWSGSGQCDWWVSAADPTSLEELVTRLLPLSDLQTSLWGHEPDGEAVLRRVRGQM